MEFEGRSEHSHCLLSAASLMVALFLFLACQSTTRIGDRYYQKARYPEAAAAYQAFLEAEPAQNEVAARSLYRIGLIYAMPSDETHDPARSIAAFDRLISEFPNSPYSIDARILRHLQLQIERLSDQAAELRQRLASTEDELAERLAELQTLSQDLEQRDLEIEALRSSIPSLQGEIRTLIRQLAGKEQELEKLEQIKAIDLADAPP